MIRHVFSGAAALVAIVLYGCSHSAVESNQPAKGAAPQADKKRVSVVEVKRMALANDLTLTAEFHPYQEVDVMAKVSGYLKKIEVDVGDRVTQGKLLAVIEVPEMADDLTRFAAAVERSQADVARARTEVARAETAHEMVHLSYTRLAAVLKTQPGLVAQQEIDAAQNRDFLAESQINTAKAALAAAEQAVKVQEADSGRAKTLYAYTNVTAPFDGIVSKRYADTGAMIQAGTSSHTQAMPVVRISQTHTLRLVLPVPESVVPRLRIGTPVEVRVPSLNRGFTGRTARFSGRISAATRTMETEVDVPNPQGILVPGMFAEATLTMDERAAALAIPPAAIDSDRGRSSVFLVTPQGRVERRGVVTGLDTPDAVEIRQGLSEGDLVITGGRDQVKEGQVVEAKRIPEKAGG